MIVTYVGRIELLTNGVGGAVATAKVILSKAPVDETPNAVVGDFDTPDYETYAAQTVSAWGDPYVDVDGVTLVDGGDYLFIADNSDVPNNIYAWGLADSTGAILYAMHAYANPIPLADAIHGCLVDLELAWPA